MLALSEMHFRGRGEDHRIVDPKVEEVYRFYTVPASNTAVGHIILENGKRAAAKGKRPAAGKQKRAAATARHRNVRRGKR